MMISWLTLESSSTLVARLVAICSRECAAVNATLSSRDDINGGECFC